MDKEECKHEYKTEKLQMRKYHEGLVIYCVKCGEVAARLF